MTLAQLYRRVPTLECQGKCTECCGPIVVAAAEARAMIAAGGPFTLDWDTKTCGYLKDGRCSVYAVRPLICRLWGVAQAMRCPFGCQPSRVLPTREGHVLMQALERIGGHWVTPDTGLNGPTLRGPT